MTRVEFHVDGKPVPQGSARAYVTKPKDGSKPKGIVTNDDDGTINKWRADIRAAARKALPAGFELIEGPVELAALFYFGRPQSHYLPITKSRPTRLLRPDAPFYCTGRGDVDKHLRSVLDALTLVVYLDDALVVTLRRVEKRWAHHGGADITVFA